MAADGGCPSFQRFPVVCVFLYRVVLVDSAARMPRWRLGRGGIAADAKRGASQWRGAASRRNRQDGRGAVQTPLLGCVSAGVWVGTAS